MADVSLDFDDTSLSQTVLGTPVKADRTKIAQVLRTVLSASVRASRRGGRVTVSAAIVNEKTDGDAKLMFRVEFKDGDPEQVGCCYLSHAVLNTGYWQVDSTLKVENAVNLFARNAHTEQIGIAGTY